MDALAREMNPTGAAAAVPEASAPHVRIARVVKRFGDFTALNGVELTIQPGELMTLLGPSGCGKTTLLRAVAGFLKQDAGAIHVGGRIIDDLPPHKRNFGMVFQSYAIFPHLSVAENVAYGLKARGVAGKALKERVGKSLERVKLSHLADRFPDAMSGGQKQRVGLARAMAIEPELLLMDEPLSNLDAKLRIEMRQEIRLMQKELGITTLYVTHDQEEAMAISDRVSVMDKGFLKQVASPKVIFDDPADAFVQDFIGGCNWFAGDLAEGVVTLSGGARFTPGLRAPAGGAVKVGLRTEDFSLRGEPGWPALDVQVVMRSYLGPRTRLRVTGADGQMFDADVPSEQPIPEEGAPARLFFAPGRARLFAADTDARLG
jgi:ABC-type Fe3+/spermidine/putrescine transport system ATPase subunit